MKQPSARILASAAGVQWNRCTTTEHYVELLALSAAFCRWRAYINAAARCDGHEITRLRKGSTMSKSLGLSAVMKKAGALRKASRAEGTEARRNIVKEAARRAEKIAETEKDLARIALSGLLTDELLSQVHISVYSRNDLRIDRADLPKWRAVGKLTAQRREFAETDAEGKNWIDVYVAVEGLIRSRIVYRRELPESAHCQVQEVVQTYKSKSLVCVR